MAHLYFSPPLSNSLDERHSFFETDDTLLKISRTVV